jgi:hypothetical protein
LIVLSTANGMKLIGEEQAEYIDEDPMTPREIERALSGHMSRRERRDLIRALRDAKLIVFRA